MEGRNNDERAQCSTAIAIDRRTVRLGAESMLQGLGFKDPLQGLEGDLS